MTFADNRETVPLDWADEPVLSLAHARAMAVEVLNAERGREVAAALRPRRLMPFLRSGLPVAYQLRLASLERRLVRHRDAVAIVEAPGDRRVPVPRGSQAQLLAALNRWWDVIRLTVPQVLLLAAGAILALWRGNAVQTYAALSLVLVALIWQTLTMIVSVVWSLALAVRTIESRREPAEPSEGMLLGRYWSVPFVHAPEAAAVPDLLRVARARADALATAVSGDRRPAPPPGRYDDQGRGTRAHRSPQRVPRPPPGSTTAAGRHR
jgi:hypothetical protein